MVYYIVRLLTTHFSPDYLRQSFQLQTLDSAAQHCKPTRHCKWAFVEKCLRSSVQSCHCFFLMANEHCSMNVWLLFMISQVIASDFPVIHVWVFDNVQKLKLRSKHLKWGFKPLRIYCHNNHNMGNVPMCQLACCIPEIADGAGRDLFSLLTPAPLTYSLLEDKKIWKILTNV